MAEFCLNCFNEMNGTDYKPTQVWLEEDFCEGCANWTSCVFALYPKPLLWRLIQKSIRRCEKKTTSQKKL